MAAVEALLYLDHTKVRDALLDFLRKRGPRGRMVYLLLVPLQAPPKEVIPLLLPWLDNADDGIRSAAMEGLYLANLKPDPKLLPALAAQLRDTSPAVRLKAAAAVGVYQNAQALKALKPSVKDPDPNVREQATIAVGWVGTAPQVSESLRQEAVDVLLQVLHSPEQAGLIGQQAAYWLGNIGDRHAVPGLKQALAVAVKPRLKKEIEDALKKLGE